MDATAAEIIAGGIERGLQSIGAQLAQAHRESQMEQIREVVDQVEGRLPAILAAVLPSLRPPSSGAGPRLVPFPSGSCRLPDEEDELPAPEQPQAVDEEPTYYVLGADGQAHEVGREAVLQAAERVAADMNTARLRLLRKIGVEVEEMPPEEAERLRREALSQKEKGDG